MTQNNENKTYEQAREELIQIVNRLENGNLDLQTSMELWKKGEQLVAQCKTLLDNFQKPNNVQNLHLP